MTEPHLVEEYLGSSRLSSIGASRMVLVAHEQVVHRNFQERHYLSQLVEERTDFASLEPGVTVSVAQLARETLAAEYNLALYKLQAAEKELTVLRDAVDEALAYLNVGENQLERVQSMLDSAISFSAKPKIPAIRSIGNWERPSNLFKQIRNEDSGFGSDYLYA